MLLTHQPITTNYSYFKAFLKNIPKYSHSFHFIEQIIPLPSLNERLSLIKMADSSLKYEDNSLLIKLREKQMQHERNASKLINQLYAPTKLINTYKKTSSIQQKVINGNIEALESENVMFDGVIATVNEYLLGNKCPVDYLEMKYLEYIRLKLGRKHYDNTNCIIENELLEDVKDFVYEMYSRDEYNAEIYEGRMLYAEVYILLRVGCFDGIKRLFADFEFFFQATCEGFIESLYEYLDNSLPCFKCYNDENVIAYEVSNTHRCIASLDPNRMKNAQIFLNIRDKFLEAIINIISHNHNNNKLISTIEDFLWLNLKIETPLDKLIDMFREYENKDGHLLFLVLYRLFDEAVDLLFSRDFDICQAYVLMKMICEKHKINNSGLLIDLTFSIVSRYASIDNKVKAIVGLRDIYTDEVIAEAIVRYRLVDIINKIVNIDLRNKVACTLANTNNYETIILNHSLFDDEILINAINELLIMNVLEIKSTESIFIKNVLERFNKSIDPKVNRAYALSKALKFVESQDVWNLRDLLASDILLIDSSEVYEKIAVLGVKSIKKANGSCAREMAEFLGQVKLSKNVCDYVNCEMVGFI